MITLGINENNDIFLDPSNNVTLKRDLNAMGDIFINKAQTRTNELKYNSPKGIDFFNTIFNSPPYPDLFQNQMITQLNDTQETQNVSDFSAQTDNSIYSYSVNIQTSYGQVTLNG